MKAAKMLDGSAPINMRRKRMPSTISSVMTNHCKKSFTLPIANFRICPGSCWSSSALSYSSVWAALSSIGGVCGTTFCGKSGIGWILSVACELRGNCSSEYGLLRILFSYMYYLSPGQGADEIDIPMTQRVSTIFHDYNMRCRCCATAHEQYNAFRTRNLDIEAGMLQIVNEIIGGNAILRKNC